MRFQKLLNLIALVTLGTFPAFAQAPVITSLSSKSAPASSTLTIKGSNFGTTTGSNIVRFGSVQATVKTATASELTVEVPAGLIFAPVSVTVNKLVGVSTTKFSSSYSAPPVDQFSNIPIREYDNLVTPVTTPYVVKVDDIDGDGKPDIIAGFNYGMVSIFRNQTDFEEGDINFGSVSTRIDLQIGSVDCAIYLTTGDINGDGKSDLVVTRFHDGIVSLLLNTSSPGNISFAGAVELSPMTYPTNPVIADLDLDGKPELLIPNAISSTLSVFQNNITEGELSASMFKKTNFTAGSDINTVAVGDLDSDGKPDIAIANSGETNISILRNTSTPGNINTDSFAPRIKLPTTGGSATIRVGDLDGDGKLDIVGGIHNFGTYITIHKNNCTPGVITPESFAGEFILNSYSTFSRTVDIADFDGDSKLDIAAISGGKFSVFRNIYSTGVFNSTSFDERDDYEIASASTIFAIGDLSGEGKPDFVAIDGAKKLFYVFRNYAAYEPVITSFSPTSARKGVEITINGAHFDSHPVRTRLYFNDIRATIVSQTATKIVALVPTGNSTGFIGLNTDIYFATTPTIFNLIDPPTISSFEPIEGKPGIVVTITGTNFDEVKSRNIVSFNGEKGTVTDASTTMLKVTVPEDATTGEISLKIDNDLTSTEDDFIVLLVTGDIESEASELVFSSYPNPTTKKLNIGLEKFSSDTSVRVQLIDMLGRVMDQVDSRGGTHVTMDVSIYAQGIYIVRVSSGDLKMEKRFIKE